MENKIIFNQNAASPMNYVLGPIKRLFKPAAHKNLQQVNHDYDLMPVVETGVYGGDESRTVGTTFSQNGYPYEVKRTQMFKGKPLIHIVEDGYNNGVRRRVDTYENPTTGHILYTDTTYQDLHKGDPGYIQYLEQYNKNAISKPSPSISYMRYILN